MTDVKLLCAVYGEGTVFPVTISRDAEVSALQEAIAGVVSTEQHVVPPRLVTLYLARKDDAWLKDDDNVDGLLSGQIDTLYKEMRPSWTLDDEDYFGDFQLGEEEIHVLVELPSKRRKVPEEEVGVAKKKPRLMWQSTQRQVHDYDPNSEYFLLTEQDVDESGLPPVRTMLYCRPLFHRQFEFLRDEVLTNCHLGWVLGPPGTGKSSTAMAFASTLKKSEWVVTWIHLKTGKRQSQCDASSTTNVGRVDSLNRMQTKCWRWKIRSLTLWSWTGGHLHTTLVICQASALTGSQTGKGQGSSGGWHSCALLLSAGTMTIHMILRLILRISACGHGLWRSIRMRLRMTKCSRMCRECWMLLQCCQIKTPREMREAMVESKYYYAGGSCRYMFHYNTADVKKRVMQAVNALSGQRSCLSVNRLYAMFQGSNEMDAVSVVTSQYAATQIAVKCGPDAIKRFMSTYQRTSNPALNGWMLLMLFFASLRTGGLELVDAEGMKIDEWKQSTVEESD